jgi:phosphate acetyltransferase
VSEFVDSLRRRAARICPRIVFPESTDERVLRAALFLSAPGYLVPVLVLDPERPDTHAQAIDAGVEVVNPATDSRTALIAERLLERRAHRGMTLHVAEAHARTPLHFAQGLVALGEVAGSVAGAVTTTADVLRAALWHVGAASGVATVSSAFYLEMGDFRMRGPEILTFTDCAMVPEPSASQLADIAIAAARDRRKIVGDDPIVGMLSYSTHGSGSGPSVDRVREATRLVREREPDLRVDGELQGDAALIENVAGRKAPGSFAAGRANVLVFPSLDAGNIGYKLVERLARVAAFGPIVQGLARPCNDLSRGAITEDIINVASITALQSVG